MLNEPTLATGASQVDYEVVEVGAPAHPKNQFILAYWRERLNADAIVLRRDVDPVDLKKVLGGLARNPLTLRALVSTGIDFNRALRSLRGCRGFLLGGESLVPADI